jgi:antitoxin component YwqK of YwqJK toxin-antitoxin module
MNIIDFPSEIIRIIADFITDTRGFISFRKTCQYIHNCIPYIKHFYSNGHLLNYIPFKDSEVHGFNSQYYINGNLYYKIRYDMGQIMDDKIGYSPNKTILFKGHFVNGEKEGIHFTFNENATISKSEEYTKGILDGRCIKYYKRGDIQCIESYKNDLPQGTFEYFKYISGKIAVKFEFNKQGQMDGFITIFSEQDLLLYIGYINKNRLHGSHITYYYNGMISSRITYCYGLKHGVAKHYYTDGKMKSIVKYKIGFREGRQTDWYQNGKVRETVMYKKNKKNGVQFKYNQDGDLIIKCSYVNNIYHGYNYIYKNNYLNIKSFYIRGFLTHIYIKYHPESDNVMKHIYFISDETRKITTYYEYDIHQQITNSYYTEQLLS